MPIGKLSSHGTPAHGVTDSSDIDPNASESSTRRPTQQPPARFSAFQEARVGDQEIEPTTRTIRGFIVEARHQSFFDKVDNALNFVNEGSTGHQLLARIDRAQTLGKMVTIREADQSVTRPAGRAASATGPALSDAQANKAAQKRSFGRKGTGSDAVIDWNADEKGSYTRLGRELVHVKRITTGTYTGGPESGDLADPRSKAAQEDQRAVGTGKYANRTPSENSIRKEHRLALHAETSTSTTAAPALRSPETVPPDITKESIEKLVFENEEIEGFIRNPKDNCANCAVEVRSLLSGHHPPIPNALRAIAMWASADDKVPENHMVVVVNIAGKEWVIDPTANQFDKVDSMMAPLDVWKNRICGSIPNQAVKWVGANSVSEADSLTMFGTAADFQGQVLAAPEWYKRTIAEA
jgi:hypothetical protein